MATKNLTPFLFGSKVTSTRPPQPQMTVIVRAKFVLRPGSPVVPPEGLPLLAQETLRGDVFRDDDDDQTGECLYASDFADFKPNADVLLRGSCHTPGKERMTECPVRFGVGSWSKILRVVGHRVWMDRILGVGPVMSDCVPFDQMPINADHAFGGPDHPLNKAGRGFGTRELPNVENSDDLLLSRLDRPMPAGFGPWSPHRPERVGKRGKKYGRSYKKKRAPYYAEDFDWSYFNAAPPDQQIPYLRGDEELLLQNLHPDAEVWRPRLPGLHIRAFAKDKQRGLRELRMNLDTLFVDLDKEALFLTWRGLTDVTEDDLSGVNVLIASEPLAESPLPLQHYADLFTELEADPTGLDDQIPAHVKGEWKALQELGRKRAQPAAAAGATPDDPVSLVAQKLGGLGKSHLVRLREVLGNIAKVFVPTRQQILGVLMNEALSAALASGSRQGSPPMSHDASLPVSPQDVVNGLRAIAKVVQAVRKQAADKGTPLKGMEAWDKLRKDPKFAVLGLSDEPIKPLPELGPACDLSGRDLSGRDLSGCDLSRANLTGTILAKANLRGAKLRGAKLKKAVLTEADLREADFTGADLSIAAAQGARAENAIFREAMLESATFDSASLMGADFSRSQGKQLVLSRADMTGALVQKVTWHMAFLEKTMLGAADFSEAELTRSFVSQAYAVGAVFARATLTGTSFADSDLSGASFTDARGEGTVWMRANLTRADFGHAVLIKSHFMEAKANEASFYGANLRGARFLKAVMERADFTRANLFDADLHKAHVPESKFVEANLYDAKFHQTAGSGCDFSGANLKRSTLENG